MANRVALLVGSGQYPEEPQLSDLAGPPNDVESLSAVLADPGFGQFAVETFVDVESHQLLPVLETTLREARPDDLILVYFSGHGKQDFGGQLCLTTVNTRLSAHVATCRHS